MPSASERRSLGEWAVLGLLAEEAAHPFALARSLGGGGPLGKVLTVRRPLVYRAVERLRSAGLIERHRREPGDSGPERTVFRITPEGRRRLDGWLMEPVGHVRDLRLGLLLKVSLLARSGRDPGPLVSAQQEALTDAFERLGSLPDEPDAADLWRHHNAAAARDFLDDLAERGIRALPRHGGDG